MSILKPTQEEIFWRVLKMARQFEEAGGHEKTALELRYTAFKILDRDGGVIPLGGHE